MSMLSTFKQAARGVIETQVPAAFLFGTVTSSAPLVIRVDNRFDISGDAIVLLREFCSGTYHTHTHSIHPHRHLVPAHSTAVSADHAHTITGADTSDSNLVTDSEAYAGLALGDKVALLRNHGGQSFLVLGRV